LKLHSVPYCSSDDGEGFVKAACVEDASAATQFLYALLAIPVTGLLQHLAESSGLTNRPGMYDDIPMILKYIVGWAFGGAFTQALIEYKEATPGVCFGDDCTLINVTFTLAITMFSAIVILILQPLSQEIEFGDGKIVNWIEDYLEDTFSMLVRGFTVVVIVLWNYTIGAWVHLGVTSETAGGATQTLDVLWAFTCTFGLAMLMVMIEAIEQSLRNSAEKKKAELKRLGLPVPTKTWQSMVIEFSGLIQGVFGSVAGNAWSAVLMYYQPTMSAEPYGAVPFINLGIIVIVTFLSCAWLVVSTTTKGVEEPENMTDVERQRWEDAQLTARETHEKAFIASGLSFLVLGGWLSVVRNGFAWFAILTENGVTAVKSATGYALPPGTGDTVAVFIFAPIFTILMFNLAELVFTGLAGVGGIEKKEMPSGAMVTTETDAKDAKQASRTEDRDPAADQLAKRKLLAENPSMVVLVLGCKWGLAKELMNYKLENGGLKIVFDFLESAAVFSLSKMWSDLISAFIFGLHAIPYCGGFVATVCTPDAPSSAQFIYALCAAPVAGLLKHLSESTGLVDLPGMYDDIPMILKYVVGWAFGGAVSKLTAELKDEYPGLCSEGGDCTMIDIGFATAATLLSAFVILVLRPFAAQIECGNSAVVNWFEDFLEDVLQMIIRGAEVVAMVLWYNTFYAFSHLEVVGSVTQGHMDFFYACTATFLGAMVMVFLESTEQNMKRIKKAEGIPDDETHWTDAVILFSDTVQSCFGFVTGCAWSDWLFETATVLGANPTVPVIFANLGLTLVLTLFSCYWLVMNTSTDGLEDSLTLTEEEKKARAEAKATDRGEVEKEFFAGALGFFVLGGWLVVVKNLFAPFMVLIESAFTFADETYGLSVPAKTGDTVAVLLFAPIFTVVMFSVFGKVMSGFQNKTPVDEVAKKAAPAKDAEGNRRKSRASSVGYDANYKGSSKELV